MNRGAVDSGQEKMAALAEGVPEMDRGDGLVGYRKAKRATLVKDLEQEVVRETNRKEEIRKYLLQKQMMLLSAKMHNLGLEYKWG